MPAPGLGGNAPPCCASHSSSTISSAGWMQLRARRGSPTRRAHARKARRMLGITGPGGWAMLKNFSVYTTLPVTDFDRARAFYSEKLGLTPTGPERDFLECAKATGFILASMGSKPRGHTHMTVDVHD